MCFNAKKSGFPVQLNEKIRKYRVFWSTYIESCYHTFDNKVVRHIPHFLATCVPVDIRNFLDTRKHVPFLQVVFKVGAFEKSSSTEQQSKLYFYQHLNSLSVQENSQWQNWHQLKWQSSVTNVTRHFHVRATWKDIWEYTQVKNRSSAPSVRESSIDEISWRLMKKSTPVINHSAATSVTTNAQTEAI